MIKYISLILCLTCLLTGCAGEPEMGMVNPMKEMASLDDINAAAGTNIQKPQAFRITDEEFFIINSDVPVADYRFSIGEAKYTFRAAKTYDDISGVYGEAERLTRWYKGDVQYSLYVQNGSDGEMRAIAAEQAPAFYPVVEEISNGYMTVLPHEDTPERASSDRIIVKIQHTDPLNEPLPGDVVEITYNGEILESYPAELGEIYSIRVMTPVM